MSGSLPFFFSRFCLHPGRRKDLVQDKTYPAIDLSVHGEFNGVSCILVEDCIRKL